MMVALLLVAVAVAVTFSARWLRARPTMTGSLIVHAGGADPVEVRLRHRRAVTCHLGGARLRVTGHRRDGKPLMRVAWTSSRGAAPPRDLHRGGHVLMAGTDLRHRP